MICSKCKKDYDNSNFHSRGNGKFHKQCKFCKREAIKRHYENNKQDYVDRAKIKNKQRLVEITEIINNIKNVPCKDCGKTFPACAMDFDHFDGREKIADVSLLRNNLCLSKILEEIEKCEVVCACCHRIRTHKRYKEKIALDKSYDLCYNG